MAGYVLLGTLADFGLLCVLWTLFGWLLPDGREDLLVAPGRPGEGEMSFARRYLWLKGLGLLKSSLVMVDVGMTDWEREWLTDKGIEICSPSELNERLGIGAEAN